MKSIIPHHLTGKEVFEFIVKNEALIIHAKKSEIKRADECVHSPLFVNDKGEIVGKEEVSSMTVSEVDQLKLMLAINSTNWYDSHSDVHIPSLWKKSISDNKASGFYLLKMHQRGFEDVIGEGMTAETRDMTWKELGVKLDGKTEVLIFSGVIEKDRNPYMFDQYRKKYVKKHSVGMRYVKMVTCINDDDYPVQKENWEKYFPMVANKSECEKDGYFWAILEAKIIEGSAVTFASNTVTPTLEVSELNSSKSNNPSTSNQPLHSTEDEPPKSEIDWDKFAQTILSKN